MKISWQRLSNLQIRLIKWCLLMVTLVYLGFRLYQEQYSVQNLWKQLQQTTTWQWFFLCLLLQPVNLFWEALKWKRMLAYVYPVSIGKALGGILTGLATGIFTPNRIGEYAGRVFWLPEAPTSTVIYSTFIGKFTQLNSTLFLGNIAWISYLSQQNIIWGIALLLPAIMIQLIAWFFVFYPAQLVWLAISILPKSITPGWLIHFAESVSSLNEQYRSIILWEALLLSLIRSFTFTSQYIFLLWAFGADISYGTGFLAVSQVFVIRSFVPSIGMA
ncbi:MAG: flippase-like domain-containing protein, partial [Bacteroidia bacterium]|nr:flippase-like domain-containing protein [Bacteroidia bacterium]